MSKRAIIFDFGGVLMKTVDHNPRLAWDARLKLSPGSVERIVHGSESWKQAQIGAITPDMYWADVRDQLHLTNDQLQQLRHDFFSGDQLDQALIEYIRTQRSAGFTVGLLSNDSPALRDKLTQLNIADLFDPLVISGEIGVMKPHPAAYQAVIDDLQRLAADVIFIDDMPINIDAAEAAGIHGIHYTPKTDLPQRLAPLLLTE